MKDFTDVLNEVGLRAIILERSEPGASKDEFLRSVMDYYLRFLDNHYIDAFLDIKKITELETARGEDSIHELSYEVIILYGKTGAWLVMNNELEKLQDYLSVCSHSHMLVDRKQYNRASYKYAYTLFKLREIVK